MTDDPAIATLDRLAGGAVLRLPVSLVAFCEVLDVSEYVAEILSKTGVIYLWRSALDEPRLQPLDTWATVVAKARKLDAAIRLRLPFSRWENLDKTSPSGKILFRCRLCGRESPTPDIRCMFWTPGGGVKPMCEDSAWLGEVLSGLRGPL
jgi:hypothetical protein